MTHVTLLSPAATACPMFTAEGRVRIPDQCQPRLPQIPPLASFFLLPITGQVLFISLPETRDNACCGTGDTNRE